MAVTVKIYREIQGVLGSAVWDISDAMSAVTVGVGDGTDDVETVIRSEGLRAKSSLIGGVETFNRNVGNINLPDSQIARDAYEARHVRVLFGFKQDNDAYEWLAEVTGGVAAVTEEHLDKGQYNNNGFAEFRIRHKPVFRRNTSIDGSYITYDNTNNCYGIGLTGLSDFGDLPALVDIYIKPIGSPVSLRRAYVGIGRGIHTVTTTKIADYTQKTLTVNAAPTELVVGGNAITLANYPSGYVMPIIRMDALPSAVSGVQISADNVRWFDVEQGHVINKTELLKLPVSRVGSLSASVYTLRLYARYINPALSGNTTTLPAGTIHLFPCDQFIDFAINGTAMSGNDELVHLSQRGITYILSGGIGIFDSVIPRPRQGIRAANDFHYFATLYEASDGTAPPTKQFGFKTSIWPRRRNA